MVVMESVNCPVCDAIQGVDLWEKDGAKYVRCTECSLVYENPRLTQSELKEFYSRQSYFEQADPHAPTVGYQNYANQCTPQLQREYFELVERFSSKQPGRYLDIGCGTGRVVQVATSRGWDATGQEISDWAAQQAINDGIKVVNDDLLNASFPADHFDAISMFDVLEHLPMPKPYLREIHRIMKPGGVLIIETPNSNGFFAKFLYRERSDIVKPRAHICLYGPKSIRRLLSEVKFSKVSISTFPYCRTFSYEYFKALIATRVLPDRALVQFTINESLRVVCWK